VSAHRPPRLYTVDDVLAGRGPIEPYPFRYVCVTMGPQFSLGGRSVANNLVDRMLSAVEMLEQRGWELFTLENNGMIAYLRRPVR
jgi:hypothetical protein